MAAAAQCGVLLPLSCQPTCCRAAQPVLLRERPHARRHNARWVTNSTFAPELLRAR